MQKPQTHRTSTCRTRPVAVQACQYHSSHTSCQSTCTSNQPELCPLGKARFPILTIIYDVAASSGSNVQMMYVLPEQVPGAWPNVSGFSI